MDEPNDALMDTLITELANAWKLYDKAIAMHLRAVSLAHPDIGYWETEIHNQRAVIYLLHVKIVVGALNAEKGDQT